MNIFRWACSCGLRILHRLRKKSHRWACYYQPVVSNNLPNCRSGTNSTRWGTYRDIRACQCTLNCLRVGRCVVAQISCVQLPTTARTLDIVSYGDPHNEVSLLLVSWHRLWCMVRCLRGRRSAEELMKLLVGKNAKAVSVVSWCSGVFKWRYNFRWVR